MSDFWKEIYCEKYKRLRNTYKGWCVWHNIVKKYDLKEKHVETAVILMPKSDDENSYYALLYLDRLLCLRNLKSALILTNDPIITMAANYMCTNLLAVECISKQDNNALLQYYALMHFDSRFIAASLAEPSGRNGYALLGVNGITKEEMVAIGVYRIVPYVQKERPVYEGNNNELEAFMSIGGSCEHKRTPRIIQ